MTPRDQISPVELLADEVAELDPNVLEPLATSAVAALLAEGESANTVRSYQTALRYWAAWFWLRYRQPITLPVPVAAIQQFIVDHVQQRTKSGLEASLPAALDQALVTNGFKAKLGTPALGTVIQRLRDRKSTSLNSSHRIASRMPSSA